MASSTVEESHADCVRNMDEAADHMRVAVSNGEWHRVRELANQLHSYAYYAEFLEMPAAEGASFFARIANG